MTVINPEVNAIPQYLSAIAQQGMVDLLRNISTLQTAINPDYEFKVEKNMYRPAIEDIQNQALVNILIAQIIPKNSTDFDKTHTVTYHIDCYVRGRNEDDPGNPGTLVPADEVAVERLIYLCSQVEFGLTGLETYYKGLSSGEIEPVNLSLNFNSVEDAEDAASPYAPARFTYICNFPYIPKDWENLPPIDETFINLSQWASRFTY